jgi:hypothetical protein
MLLHDIVVALTADATEEMGEFISFAAFNILMIEIAQFPFGYVSRIV